MDIDQGCPDSTRWGHFLEGNLAEGDQADLIAHLDVCARCREELDRLSATGLFKGMMPQVALGLQPPDLLLARALAELKAEATTTLEDPAEPPPPSGKKPTDAGALGPKAIGEKPYMQGAFEANEKPKDANDLERPDLSFLSRSDDPRSLGRLGQYEVTERIGQGGMGIVLKAHDPGLNRVVAIKVLAPEMAMRPDARRRFTREARAVAAVCHENVVTIYAVSEEGTLPYFVMQYVAGQSLQKKIDRTGPLSLTEILRIGMQAASGLGAAHAQGLVHRDIKPANILLENGVERVRITDFGLARAIDDLSLSERGTVVGTPNYMSPEQARGEPVDERTDLFSLGSTLYAMATGQPPFRAISAMAVLRKVSDEHPRPIKVLAPEVPDWLVATVARLQAKDPEDRFQSAGEVAELLSRQLADLQQPSLAPVTTPPTWPLPRAQHRDWRQFVFRATLAAMATAIAIAALVMGVLYWKRASPNREPAVAGGRSADPTPHGEQNELQPPATEPTKSQRVVKLLEQAEDAIARNDNARAIKLFTEALRLNPDNASAHETLGWLHLNDKDNQRAIAAFSEALRLEPNRTSARSGRGMALSILNDLDRAIADFTAVILATPEDFATLALRADAYQRRGDYALAIADLTQAIKLDPRNVRLYGGRALACCWAVKPDEAIRDLDEALKLNPDNSYRAYLLHLRGWARALKKNWDDAIADYTQALQTAPRTDYAGLFALLGRANCHAEAGRFEQALVDYDELIGLDSVMERHARCQRALYVHFARKDFDRAIADCHEAVRLAPAHVEAYLVRGLALLKKGQPDRAIIDFNQAITLNRPNDWTFVGPFSCRYPELYFGRGRALATQSEYKRAIADFDAAIRLGRQDAEVYHSRGEAKAKLGDTTGAKADHDRAAQLKTNVKAKKTQ